VRRSEVLLLLGIWVLPVLLAAVFLALVDLGVLAIALVAIEVVVGTSVFVVRRTPEGPSEPSKRPWLVPAIMVGALGLMVVVAVIASRMG
jgi:hypothetical protein